MTVTERRYMRLALIAIGLLIGFIVPFLTEFGTRQLISYFNAEVDLHNGATILLLLLEVFSLGFFQFQTLSRWKDLTGFKLMSAAMCVAVIAYFDLGYEMTHLEVYWVMELLACSILIFPYAPWLFENIEFQFGINPDSKRILPD